MKRSIFTILTLGLAFASCSEEFTGQPATDHIAPGPVTNVRVTNLEGSAYITYDLPDDEDLLYVEGRYRRNQEVFVENKASVYTDTLRIFGLGDTLAREVEIVAVDRSGNISSPVSVTIHPKTPPIYTVFESLAVEASLSGIQLDWVNEKGLDLAISVIRWDKNEYVPVEVIYSSQKAGSYGVRKQKAKETQFGIYVRDKWMNYSDTLFVTLTPIYEERVVGLSIYKMQGDGIPEWTNDGFKPEYLFEDNQKDGGFHTGGSSGSMPHHFTFRSEKSYELRRFKVFHRANEDRFIFNEANPKDYELWGTNEVPSADGSWNGWTCIGKYASVKPSGLPIGQLSAEDRERAVLGEENLIPVGAGLFKYYRFKVTRSWGDKAYFHIKKIELYGVPEGYDPDAPVEDDK